MSGFRKSITDLGYELEISDEAKTFIAEKGYDQQYGARPLKRAIQKYLEDELAEMIINSKLLPGDTIKVDFDKTENKIQTTISHINQPESDKE